MPLPRPRSATPAEHEIVSERCGATVEGWIERIHRRRHGVEVLLSLADGSATGAFLAHEHADWLELEPGQIVALRPGAARPSR